MKPTSRFWALFFAAAPVVWAQSPAAESKPAPAGIALRFERVALGNVVRVISAKFNVPITIAANATVPVTGDFSNLTLDKVLEQAASQAGLVSVALGKSAKDGFSLEIPANKAQGDEATPISPGEKAALAAAAERRAELLRKRKALLDQEAPRDVKPTAPAAENGPP